MTERRIMTLLGKKLQKKKKKKKSPEVISSITASLEIGKNIHLVSFEYTPTMLFRLGKSKT